MVYRRSLNFTPNISVNQPRWVPSQVIRGEKRTKPHDEEDEMIFFRRVRIKTELKNLFASTIQQQQMLNAQQRQMLNVQLTKQHRVQLEGGMKLNTQSGSNGAIAPDHPTDKSRLRRNRLSYPARRSSTKAQREALREGKH